MPGMQAAARVELATLRGRLVLADAILEALGAGEAQPRTIPDGKTYVGFVPDWDATATAVAAYRAARQVSCILFGFLNPSRN